MREVRAKLRAELRRIARRIAPVTCSGSANWTSVATFDELPSSAFSITSSKSTSMSGSPAAACFAWRSARSAACFAVASSACSVSSISKSSSWYLRGAERDV